jgi:hypothetical protein
MMKRRFWFAISLFFLAPLVAEFLLGNQAITNLGGLFLLAPIYGGSAVLIREITRRTGRGWPTMIILGAAFGLFLEGIIDQMIFNPAYLRLDTFEGLTPIPGLHISASLLQASLTLHTIWSICVPIALVEALDKQSGKPWLKAPGLVVTALILLAGSVVSFYYQSQEFHFVASASQFIWTSLAILALTVASFTVRKRLPRSDKAAPSPVAVGVTALLLSSIYWLESTFLPENSTAQWLSVCWWFILVGLSIWLLIRWSRCHNWSSEHRLALAGGALVTYTWVGFVNGQYLEVSRTTALLGNVVFAISALLLLAVVIRRRLRYTS